MHDERLDKAFAAWVGAQSAALEVVHQATGVPESEVDLAEGYRWVTRLSRLALDWIVECSDPLHPQLFTLQDEYKKLLVDNPDVHYTFCVLDDARTYRLVGYRGRQEGSPRGRRSQGRQDAVRDRCARAGNPGEPVGAQPRGQNWNTLQVSVSLTN